MSVIIPVVVIYHVVIDIVHDMGQVIIVVVIVIVDQRRFTNDDDDIQVERELENLLSSSSFSPSLLVISYRRRHRSLKVGHLLVVAVFLFVV